MHSLNLLKIRVYAAKLFSLDRTSNVSEQLYCQKTCILHKLEDTLKNYHEEDPLHQLFKPSLDSGTHDTFPALIICQLATLN